MNAREHRWTAVTAVRWRGVGFALGATAVTAAAAFQISPGVNPDSLWLDDQWVASLVRHASPATLLSLMPPVPLGFILLLKGAVSCAGWGQWQLQALPIVFAIVQIPLIGRIAWRMTGSVSLGLVAAALLSSNRTLMTYGLRVKQYTLESLIALVLIWLAMACVRRPRAPTFALLLVAAALALPFSFTAVPVGLVIVNALTLHLCLCDRGHVEISRSVSIVGCAAYDTLVLAWLWLLYTHQPNALMTSFWTEYYAPFHTPPTMWQFAHTHALRLLTGALPAPLGWLGAGVPLAIVLLCWRRTTRLIGVALLLFYGSMLIASSFKVYPLGGRRTDVFSYPITILAVVGAIGVLGRSMKVLSPLALVGMIVYMLMFFPEPPIHYPQAHGQSTVATASRLVQDRDGLIVAPLASWAVACYGPWPVEFSRSDDSTTGFIADVHRNHTVTLRASTCDGTASQDSSDYSRQIDPLLSAMPSRVFYLSIYPWRCADESVPREIESRGYVRRNLATGDDSLLLFERDNSSPDPTSPDAR